MAILCLGVTSGYPQAECLISATPTSASESALPPESCVPPELSVSDLAKLAANEGNLAWGTSLATALKNASTSGRHVLVFFTASDCEECTRMQALVFSDSYIQMRMGNFELVRIDLTKEAAAARNLDATEVPALLRVMPDGRVLESRQGLLTKDELLSMLRQAPRQK